MNRTGAFGVCRKSARKQHQRLDAIIEAEVSDPRFADDQAWMGSSVDVVLSLLEMCPADPGERSGAELRLCDAGEHATLTAGLGHHVLGFLPGPCVREFASRALPSFSQPDYTLSAQLGEFYQEEPITAVNRLSGAELQFCGGPIPSLQIRFGEHVFGIARGVAAQEFLRRALYRVSVGIDQDTPEQPVFPNTVCITSARRTAVAAGI